MLLRTNKSISFPWCCISGVFLYFNFAGPEVSAIGENTYRYSAKEHSYLLKCLNEGVQAQFYCGNNDPIAGWQSKGYSQKFAIGEVGYHIKAAVPLTMTTVLEVEPEPLHG